MKGEKEVIYLKPDRNSLVKQPKVQLSDVAKLECESQEILRKIKCIEIYRFEKPQKGKTSATNVIMSVLKVIELIHKECPGVLVVNEGESDFVIELEKTPVVGNWFDKAKTAILCVIIFCGSAYSIMAFNNDVDIMGMFEKFCTQVMGNATDGMMTLQVSYCVGLLLGIMIFFNHVGMKKITSDPTPLQVQMRKYEKDIDTTFIENASRGEHNIDVD